MIDPRVLTWLKDGLPDYGAGLMVLAAVAVAAWPVRRAVSGGRLGPTDPQRNLPLATAWAVALVPVAWWLWSIWAAFHRPEFFLTITDEDGWMEYGQVLLLSLGSLTAGWLAWSLWKDRQRVWALGYLVLTLALFWAAGEEISWGQRLLHLATPAWFEAHNVQQEMNLHNLGNTDGRLSSLTNAVVSSIVFASAALWMTGLHRIQRLRSVLWLPHPALIPALCCVVSYWKVTRLYTLLHPEAQEATPAVLQLQEPRETILYFCVLAFLLIAASAYLPMRFRKSAIARSTFTG
ncbi:MAG TPA: hypothetical protein VJY35_10775 [Candidatus Eisenbacteria bacterium]|nr:hypothetical protein [Candidatus Eisenbacteria bacterium]